MNINIFPCIPTINTEEGVVSETIHYGAGNYVTLIENSTKEEYDAYLQRIEEVGYKKIVDNGAGLGEVVFSATYQKEEAALTVIYVLKRKRIYVSFRTNLPISEHLFYKGDYIKNNKEGAKTSLHMLELWDFGNSFVIQLKNGHFVISDGGQPADIRYLLDYLESLIPEGEKPVVEGWFISHSHGDHNGALGCFLWEKELCSRVIVEGIYFNEPSEAVYYRDPVSWLGMVDIHGAARYLRNSEGKHPKIYRPQTGQRYYFNDITIDIVHTQEQLPNEAYMNEDYPGDFNDSSTWCMCTIEGQKILLAGDGDVGGMDVLMSTYNKDYFEIDVLTLMHHGFNTYDKFSDYTQVNTVLVPARDRLPACRIKQNAYLKNQVKEWILFGDGTKVLSFPYKVGEYKTLPCLEWKYHEGKERPKPSPIMDVILN